MSEEAMSDNTTAGYYGDALVERLEELEQALMDVKHLTDPIIERARCALECKS